MSRSARLFDLLHALRRRRAPVSGEVLASEIGVSVRTLYRDIATLQAQGAEIHGEAGVGYVLKPGFLLPSLMFSRDEIDALALGMRWVIERTDGHLANGAESALSRIAAVLPLELRRELEASTLLIAPGLPLRAETVAADVFREAIRTEHKLRIDYCKESGARSTRIVWPFALAFFDQARVLMAWCETRSESRNFRTDRILTAEILEARSPKPRRTLLDEWRKTMPPGHDLANLGRAAEKKKRR